MAQVSANSALEAIVITVPAGRSPPSELPLHQVDIAAVRLLVDRNAALARVAA